MSQKVQRNLKRENENRRKKTAKAREDKVVIGYVKTKYPKVYQEAYNYAQELDRANPNKLDLTKTSQFRAMLKVPFTDNMELKIELMDEGNQPATKNPETSQDFKAAETSQDFKAVETSQDFKAAETTQDFKAVETSQDFKAVETSQDFKAAETSQDLLPLGEEDFKSLIHDLSQDPNIQDFFSNIEFELDGCPMW